MDKRHKIEVIQRNAVQCLDCGVVLESKHRHDYKMCSCDNQTMVDGGTEYLRRGGKNLSRILNLSIMAEEEVPCSKGYDGKCWRCEHEERRKKWDEENKVDNVEAIKTLTEDKENG